VAGKAGDAALKMVGVNVSKKKKKKKPLLTGD
jgi:hypothetical protein